MVRQTITSGWWLPYQANRIVQNKTTAQAYPEVLYSVRTTNSPNSQRSNEIRRDEIKMRTQNNILSGDQNRPRRLPSFSDTHRIAISAHQFKYFAQKLLKSMWHNRQNWLNSPAVSDLPAVIRFAVSAWPGNWTHRLLARPCHGLDEGRRHTGI